MIGDNPSRELRETITFTSLAFYSHLTMSQTLVLFFFFISFRITLSIEFMSFTEALAEHHETT